MMRLAQLPLGFLAGYSRPGMYPVEDGALEGDEGVLVQEIDPNEHLSFPPGVIPGFVGHPPKVVDERLRTLQPRAGTVALISLPDPGKAVRVYLVRHRATPHAHV